MIFKINASFAKSQNVSTFETFILRKILKYLYGIFFLFIENESFAK